MTWQQRIKEGRYQSPKGRVLSFVVDDSYTESFDKKSTAFEFPTFDGTYVQDLGNTSRRFPVRFIFWGDDADTQAESAMIALEEPGIGRLEHPVYGTRSVTPVGRVEKLFALVQEANQVVVSCEFFETISTLNPRSQRNSFQITESLLRDFQEFLGRSFGASVRTVTAFDRLQVTQTVRTVIQGATTALNAIINVTQETKSTYERIRQSIDRALDTPDFLGDIIGSQVAQLFQSTAPSSQSVLEKIQAYDQIVTSIIDTPLSSENVFSTLDMHASAALSGLSRCLISGAFDSKPQVIDAIEIYRGLLDSFVKWRDDAFDQFNQRDTGLSFQSVQNFSEQTMAYLVEISFSVRQERRVVLLRPRTVIDLTYDLTGTLDDQLDFFINSNDLNNQEILTLQAGREIVYYV